MENERSNVPAVDRLSSLHDSILHHILSFLPTEESIGTSFLSKRFWRTWVFVPALKFLLNTPNDVNFVDQVIAHRSSSHVRTFSIVSEQNLGSDRLSLWVNYAVAHSVQEMEIHLNWETDLNILDHLYHCQSLESLSLWAVLEQPLRLPDPQTPCFTNLKILNLLLSNLYPGDSIGDLVSKCRKLEELRLGGVCFEAVNISAPNLRILELALLHCFEIQVSCPRLEYLVLGLHEELESFHSEMPSLHRVDIEMPPINYESNLFWRQILKSVNHAAQLHFSYVDFKVRFSWSWHFIVATLTIFNSACVRHHNGFIWKPILSV